MAGAEKIDLGHARRICRGPRQIETLEALLSERGLPHLAEGPGGQFGWNLEGTKRLVFRLQRAGYILAVDDEAGAGVASQLLLGTARIVGHSMGAGLLYGALYDNFPFDTLSERVRRIAELLSRLPTEQQREVAAGLAQAGLREPDLFDAVQAVLR
jgi:hypothetical protein